MESYLRFWRLFPRLALGFVFLSAIIFTVLGRSHTYQIIAKLETIDLRTLGNLSSGIISIIFIVLFCSLGLFILEFVCYAIGLGFTFASKRRCIRNVLEFLGLYELTIPISKIAIDFLVKNKDELLEFISLKNASNPDLIPHTEKVKQIATEAVNHAASLKNSNLIEGISLYGAVTQDRKWLERRVSNNLCK